LGKVNKLIVREFGRVKCFSLPPEICIINLCLQWDNTHKACTGSPYSYNSTLLFSHRYNIINIS
jgi:hypothetical protein